jgi:hypothetical protein
MKVLKNIRDNIFFNLETNFKPDLGREDALEQFENETVSNDFYKYWNMDPRINHLVEDNHIILAERVCKFFIDGQLPDLVNGYATGVITSKNYKDNG